jgi:uncharacterized protein with PhoU and TrkA domain
MGGTVSAADAEPPSVRDLLTKMKDVSDLMVDLAYATVFFEDRDLARCMSQLEERMDGLMYDIRSVATVVTRNVDEARRITGILQVASGAEAISNATGDIADLIRRGIKIHPVVREAFAISDEQFVKLRVAENSELAGKTFRDLRLPSRIGVWTFGLRKGRKWILPPSSDTRIEAGDVMLSKGPREGISELCEMAGCRPEKRARRLPDGLRSLRRALGEMKDLTIAMVDAAYSSLLFNSRDISEEVLALEEKFDKLNYSLWLETLKAARHETNLKKLNSVLQLVRSMERISDAADTIADVVRRGDELHPLFSAVLKESQEQIGRTSVSVGSPFVGKTLGELKLWKTLGVYVFMVKRGRRYVVRPGRNFRIRAGDVLFLRGSKAGIETAMRSGAGE